MDRMAIDLVCDFKASDSKTYGEWIDVYKEAEGQLKDLRAALSDMLYIFDRDLMEGTIGRGVCDKAIEALRGKVE